MSMSKTQQTKMERHPAHLIGCAKCKRTGIQLVKVPTIGKPKREWPYYCPLCLSTLGEQQ